MSNVPMILCGSQPGLVGDCKALKDIRTYFWQHDWITASAECVRF